MKLQNQHQQEVLETHVGDGIHVLAFAEHGVDDSHVAFHCCRVDTSGSILQMRKNCKKNVLQHHFLTVSSIINKTAFKYSLLVRYSFL